MIIRKIAAFVLSLFLLLSCLPYAAPMVRAQTDPDENKVLQIITGTPQWEGIAVDSGAAPGLGLDPAKSYDFHFRLYTPNMDTGIRFQANTDNGWNWDMIVELAPEELQPEGWFELSGSLNLAAEGVAGLPTLVFAKCLGQDEGEAVTFWIDDFSVTETDGGAVVYTEDFQDDKADAFKGNGGSFSVVAESAIHEEPVVYGESALDVPSLKEIYKDHFLFGNIINPIDFGDDAVSQKRYAIYKHHYNALTYENDMKPDAMWGPGRSYDKPPERDFANLDAQIKRMQDDGFAVIGHTLSWHGQSPNWLNLSAGNREDDTAVYKPYAEARQNLEDFIAVAAGRFNDHPQGISIYSWDVLNEAIRRNSSYLPEDEENWGQHTLGHIWPSKWTSPWFQCYSTDAPEGVNPWDYVYDVFTLTRKADPSTILYYNDYGMEDPVQVQLVVNMVNALNAQWAADSEKNPEAGSYTGTNAEIVGAYLEAGGRLLIEGIGMQEHDTISTNLKRVESAIQAYAATGCKVSITELDVGVPGYGRGERLSEDDAWKQAKYFAELFVILKNNSESIERVTFWGLDDLRNWRAGDLCQLFDGDLRTKEAYYAVADPEGWLAANPTMPSLRDETAPEPTPAPPEDPSPTPLPATDTPAPEETPQPTVAPTPSDTETPGDGPGAVVIVLVVAGVLVAGGVGFFVYRKVSRK